jgi:glycosyltransferase involved in cell wall biosynthesis
VVKLSVIITSYNQDDITIAHLKGCMNSTRLPDEIIVVNDGGGEELLNRIKELNKNCPITYARITDDLVWNQNGARNLGLYLSTGDYIALEDNDHIPSKYFYEEALKLFPEYDGVVVNKRIVISEEDIKKSEWKPIGTRGTAEIISIRKREHLLKIKGFDEQFCGQYGWDVPDFVNRIKKVGSKVTSVGYYYVVNSLSATENRTFWGNGTTKMNPVNYHNYKRNIRNEVLQPTKGILNFNYTVIKL